MPLINARPMIVDLHHAGTMAQIMAVLEQRHPAGSLAGATAVEGWPTRVEQEAEV
jgi:hypothetical protein